MAVVTLYTLFHSIVRVRRGFTYTVERFGQYCRTLEPGFHLIVPFVEQIGRRINMMETMLDIPPLEVLCADNAKVEVDADCCFLVTNPVKASYEINDISYALRILAMTNIRTVVGLMELDKMLSARDDINTLLFAVVSRAAEPWGIKVTRIELRNITPLTAAKTTVRQQHANTGPATSP
ncbi:MAG: paraslipin [Gammaproteobacteria bacterium]|nr:paraslipin [Gammaproteobacteria bacterium]